MVGVLGMLTGAGIFVVGLNAREPLALAFWIKTVESTPTLMKLLRATGMASNGGELPVRSPSAGSRGEG